MNIKIIYYKNSLLKITHPVIDPEAAEKNLPGGGIIS
jgi:hypothetical protein